jgi:hypothetical protein
MNCDYFRLIKYRSVCFRKRIVRQISPDPSDTEVEDLHEETFSIPLPPKPLVSQTRKPLKSYSTNVKAPTTSEHKLKSKTISTGSCSELNSSARKASVTSNTRSLPVEHLHVPSPPPPITTHEASDQFLVDIPGDEELHTNHVSNATLNIANNVLVTSQVSPQIHEAVEMPMSLTPLSPLSASLPLATTPLTSKSGSSLQLGNTRNSSGNPAGIMVETVSNRRNFHHTDTSSSGMF